MVAGPASHGWNEHEYPKGVQTLAEGIRSLGLGIEVLESEGWPESVTDEKWDAVVLYCDGEGAHVAKERVDELRTLYRKGTGIAVLHYALEPCSKGDALHAFFMESIGGCFEVNWSVNPVWKPESVMIEPHPVSQGVDTITLLDEWYFHMRFRENSAITPILSAHPPIDTLGTDGARSGNPHVREALMQNEAQVLAWTHEGEKGQRGFAFTGGHYHSNWANDDFRKLVINGILWTAQMEVPNRGFETEVSPIPRYATMEEAIARRDAGDVAVHLELNPSKVNEPGRGSYFPLHVAVLRQQLPIVKLLLEKGANPDALTSAGENCLHLAVKRGSRAMVELLMKHQVRSDLRDRVGWTPLHHAAAKRKDDLLKSMLEHGGDVNVLSAAGGTALHEAAASGDAATIELLLEYGVDRDVVSLDGKTALDIAIEFSNEVAIERLQ